MNKYEKRIDQLEKELEEAYHSVTMLINEQKHQIRYFVRANKDSIHCILQ